MKFNINLENDFDLKFGCHTIHIKFVDKEHPILNSSSGTENNSENNEGGDCDGGSGSEELFGCYIGDDFTIYVRKNDPYSIRLSTFLHELIHTVEQIYILDFDHKELNIVSEVFAQILIDNFEDGKMEKDRIKCGDCNSEYCPRKFVDGTLNYKCPVCEQKETKTNESLELEQRKILHD